MFHPDPVAFSILGKDIYWYGITMATGVLVGLIIAMKSAKYYRWKADDLLDFLILAIPVSLICARAYYVVFEWELYRDNPITALYIWQGGLALYGSLIGAIIAAVIFTKWKKLSIVDLLDICSPAFVMGQAIGRWGNFFNQEAFGAQITNPNLMWFPFAVHIEATNTVHYATFFYESLWCLLLCVFLLLMRKKFRHRLDVFLTYLMLYGFERMIVEGLRTDSLYITGTSIRVSQLISAILFAGLAVFFIARHIYEAKHGYTITNKANPAYEWPLDEAPDAVEDGQATLNGNENASNGAGPGAEADSGEAVKDENAGDAGSKGEPGSADSGERPGTDNAGREGK